LIRATRLDADGEFVWVDDIVTMCSVASEKVHIEGSYFANDQIICTWEDDRNGGRDIYAQNINLDGTLGSPTANGTIEGSVVIDGGIGSVEDVLVTAGSVSVNPNADGDYIISISSGTYEVTASLEYYTPQTIIDVVVTEGNATTGIDFILDWIPVYNPPQNLAVNDITGLVTWDPPMLYPGAEVEGYNFYMDGAFVEYCELLSFQLENLINGVEYTIGITSVYDGGWESAIVEVIFFYNGTNAGNNLVATTKLMNNYPNPFNPITNISYSIKDRGNVTIEVYNLKGQLVKALVNETKEAGDHSVIWDGSDKLNKLVSSGIYLYRMKSNNSTTTKKMILLK
ncbi:MAG: T9SS type A sorting domain-containing protein, partial [Candidatus Cloacimonetes bacterium]|nr:T9SS type A sorting domain-containing protein [Candidatus Cloacimonadota bacterium]